MSPDAHGIAVVGLIVVALYLFTRDRLPLESSSLAVIIVLVAGFQLFPYEVDGTPFDPAQFLLGFGNEALIAICSLIVIGKALETTGALQPVARFVGNLWLKRPNAALLFMLVAVFVSSAFVNVYQSACCRNHPRPRGSRHFDVRYYGARVTGG
jgi:di/tricarboxylate transporter